MNEMLRGDFTSSLRPQGGPDNRFVEFYTGKKPNRAKSIAEGRPVHDHIPFVRIQTPGDNLNVINRPATDNDAAEWPKQWANFAAGRQAIPEGTPLEILLPNNPEVVEHLHHLKVFVIEQLAAANDTALQSMGMGARKLQEDAKAYLAMADKGKGFHELRASVEKMQNEMKARDDKIAALTAEVTRLEATQPKGKGGKGEI